VLSALARCRTALSRGSLLIGAVELLGVATLVVAAGALAATSTPAITSSSLAPATVVSAGDAQGGQVGFDPSTATGLVVWNGPAETGRGRIVGRRIDGRGLPQGPIIR